MQMHCSERVGLQTHYFCGLVERECIEECMQMHFDGNLNNDQKIQAALSRAWNTEAEEIEF